MFVGDFMSEDKKNERKEFGSFTRTALQDYIAKVGVERSIDAFAAATDRNQEAFSPIGTIIISFASETLPEDFNEIFQKNLEVLEFKATITLVGSPAVGFISTKNRIRIMFIPDNIMIQLGYNTELTPMESAKIGVAAIKSMVRNPKQKNISLGAFSDDLLLQSTRNLLQKQGFVIEEMPEKKEKNKEPIESKIESIKEKKSKPIHFFSTTKNSSKKTKQKT